MTNVLINLVNKIKMAHKNKEHSVTVRSSLLCVRVLRILQQEGVILSFTLLSTQRKEDVNVKYVKVYLKYYNGRPLISTIDVVSLPSARKYYSMGDAYKYFFRNSLQGFYIISTPQGITTSAEVLSLTSKFSGIMGEILIKIKF